MASSPRTTNVMRDRLGSSVSPTARLSMLKPRDASIPETWASTPGWFCTSADRTCRMRPVLVEGYSLAAVMILAGSGTGCNWEPDAQARDTLVPRSRVGLRISERRRVGGLLRRTRSRRGLAVQDYAPRKLEYGCAPGLAVQRGS